MQTHLPEVYFIYIEYNTINRILYNVTTMIYNVHIRKNYRYVTI